MASIIWPIDPNDPVKESMVLPAWYALYTRSHCERLVDDHLKAWGFHTFLPEVEVWSRRAGIRHLISVPLFPGYLFLHHAMDKQSYLTVRKTRGLVIIPGERWDHLAVIPDEEIEVITRVMRSGIPILSHPYLQEGTRIRIVAGPLAGVEGILVERRRQKGLVVLSIEILQRSIAVEIKETLVNAI